MKKMFPFRQQPTIADRMPNMLRIAIDFDKTTGQAKINVNQPIQPLDLIGILNQTMAGTIALAAQQQSLIIDPNKGNKREYESASGHDFRPCLDNAVICRLCGSHKGNHDAPFPTATPATPESNSNEPQAS